MRLGLFGGSFDPVHYGHLLLAETCREERQLDQVWFVPAALPPHKQQVNLSSGAARVAMLQLALGHPSQLAVSTMELDRGGISYTFETLAAVHEQHPDAELFFLMGADSLQELPLWKRPDRICQLAIPLVVRRSGSPEPDLDMLREYVDDRRLEQIRASQVEAPLLELSSSDIRRRVRHGASIRYRTPLAVEQYILEQGLYS